VAIEYPVGHKRRREEGMPLLIEKYKTNLARIFDKNQIEKIEKVTLNYEELARTPVNELMEILVKRV
jgi:2-methylcitrate dehydratase